MDQSGVEQRTNRFLLTGKQCVIKLFLVFCEMLFQAVAGAGIIRKNVRGQDLITHFVECSTRTGFTIDFKISALIRHAAFEQNAMSRALVSDLIRKLTRLHIQIQIAENDDNCFKQIGFTRTISADKNRCKLRFIDIYMKVFEIFKTVNC